MFRGLFSKRKGDSTPVVVPEALMQEDPVNYNSVLDYLVGLSKADYAKMTKSAEIYREANTKVAKVIGVKDEPTTSIRNDKPELGEEELDAMLNAHPDDLSAAFLDDAPESPKPKKAQASDKKVEVKAEDK